MKQENDWVKGEEMETVFETKCGQRFTQNKKLIGYKLIKPEYKEAALKLCGEFVSFSNNYLSISEDVSIPKLKEAGVMHWFEEVYEKETIMLKSGVKLSEDDIAEVKEILNNK